MHNEQCQQSRLPDRSACGNRWQCFAGSPAGCHIRQLAMLSQKNKCMMGARCQRVASKCVSVTQLLLRAVRSGATWQMP